MSTSKGSLQVTKTSPKFGYPTKAFLNQDDELETPKKASRANLNTDETARISEIALSSSISPGVKEDLEDKDSENEDQDDDGENSEELSDEDESQLEGVCLYLMKLANASKISVDECEYLTNWAIDKVSEGKAVTWIIGKLMITEVRMKIIEQCRFVGQTRVKNVSKIQRVDAKQLQNKEINKHYSPVKTHFCSISGDELWNQFVDEYNDDHELSNDELEVWKANIKVKLNQSDIILKDLNSQMSAKRESNLKFKQCDNFERYVKDLKADLVKVSLCSNRLEQGHLVNPRRLPDPSSKLFRTNLPDQNSFLTSIYSDSLMLYTNLDLIATKVSNYVFSVILSSMQDNAAAQEVIRAHGNSGDFALLFGKLKQRFQVNSDIEKEKLVTEFQRMVISPKESLRAYYSRILTIVSELMTVFGREILPEDIRRTFFQALPDTSKNNFLQLESVDMYKNNLDALCMEVITRHEQLESVLSTSTLTANNINYDKREQKEPEMRKCHNCGKIGHLRADCWSKTTTTSKRSNVNNKSRHDSKRDYNKSRRFMNKRKNDQKGEVQNKRTVHFKDPSPKRKFTVNNVTANEDKDEDDEDEEQIQCYLCNQRGDHTSADCKNAHADVQYHNQNHLKYERANKKQDKSNPAIKYRVCTVTIKPPSHKPSSTVTSSTVNETKETDYFTVSNRHGPEFALLTMDVRVIVVDSGASKCMFGNKAMFSEYSEVYDVFVYTASGEAIPVLGKGTVGVIRNCLHVPYLEKDLISVPQLDMELGWRTTMGGGKAIIVDRQGNKVFDGVLNKKLLLYTVDRDEIVGKHVDHQRLQLMEIKERALAVMTKCDYVNKLHDISHAHARRLEASVRSGVFAWPFDPKKVKPVGFIKCLNPCDACGLAKLTRMSFKGKILTDMTIGAVWQTDVCGKWPVPSIQGNSYTIGFMERASRKLFLYFSTTKVVYDQVKDLLESEIPKLRLRHGLKDFIIHSDVGEFQSDRIKNLVRTYGGEIEKGTAYTPEHQCFIERAWRTIREMASTFIIAAGLSEPYWECAQEYAALIYNRTVRPTAKQDELKSPDDIYYNVLHDMIKFEPFGCKAYLYVAKEVRRKNHKGRAEMAIFVGFEENTVPGYKFYRPLYRDFVTTAHCKFMKFIRRSDINLLPESDGAELKEGGVEDFRYLENTIHVDDVDGLVYETTRIVEEVYSRRGTFIVAYRRPVYKNGIRGPEEREGIHVRDIEKMTAVTDEQVIEEYGVEPMGAPGEEGESGEEDCDNGALGEERSTSTAQRQSERVSGTLDEEKRLGIAAARAHPSRYNIKQQEVAEDGTSGSARPGPLSGHKRENAVKRIREALDGTPAKRHRIGSAHAEKGGLRMRRRIGYNPGVMTSDDTDEEIAESSRPVKHGELLHDNALDVDIVDDSPGLSTRRIGAAGLEHQAGDSAVSSDQSQKCLENQADKGDSTDIRRYSKRVRRVTDRLAFQIVDETTVGQQSNEEPDDIYGLLAAALTGDEAAHFALAMNTTMLDYPEPTTMDEALLSPDAEEWQQAANEEFASMKRCNLLSDPVPLPANGRVVGTKWVFKRKRSLAGLVERFRARLVAKGFMQVFGLDYFGTYAPVARLATLRLVYALSVLLDLKLASLDVEAAFLNADLQEEMYIHAPPGTESLPRGHVYRLKKSLYGLKQSPKEWNALLTAFMTKECGFTQLKSESCLFIKRLGDKFVICAIYVDDIIVAYNCETLFQSFRSKLTNRFKCKDLGTLTRALNMEIVRTADGSLFLSQESYIRDVLERFKDHVPASANSSDLPADPKIRLYSGGAKVVHGYNAFKTTGEYDTEEASKDCGVTVPYRELLGAMLWISQGTRPDITYAVSQCAKFASKPKNAHWWALKKVLRYLKGTIDYGILYKRPGVRQSVSLANVTLPEAYMSSVSAREAAGISVDGNVDADYANSLDDRRSVTGYINFMAEGPVTWQSKTQTSVALSTMEAEYMALAAETQEAIWLRMVFEELGVVLSGPLVIKEDNKACQMFADHAGNFARTKHIDVRFHFVRERIMRGDIRVDYVRTTEQLADIFTKALPREQFKTHRSKIVVSRSSLEL